MSFSFRYRLLNHFQTLALKNEQGQSIWICNKSSESIEKRFGINSYESNTLSNEGNISENSFQEGLLNQKDLRSFYNCNRGFAQCCKRSFLKDELLFVSKQMNQNNNLILKEQENISENIGKYNRDLRRKLIQLFHLQNQEEIKYYWNTLNKWIKQVENNARNLEKSQEDIYLEMQQEKEKEELFNSYFDRIYSEFELNQISENSDLNHRFKYYTNLNKIQKDQESAIDTFEKKRKVDSFELSASHILEIHRLVGWSHSKIKRKWILQLNKRNKLTSSQKKYILNWLQEKNYPKLSSTEKENLFQQICSLPDSRIISIDNFYKFLSNHKYPRGKLTNEKIKSIIEWILKYKKKPTLSERIEIASQLNLSPNQILTQINIIKRSKQRSLNKKTQLSVQVREKIKAFIQNQKSNNISLKNIPYYEKKKLIEETNIDLHTLNQYLQYYFHVSGTVNEKSKMIIRSWLEKNHYKKPNKDEMNELCLQTDLNTFQMRSQIRSMHFTIKHGKIQLTDEKKEKIIQYYRIHNNIPIGDQLSEFSKEIELSPKQIYDFYRRWEDKKNYNPLSDEIKQFISTWMCQNNRLPTSEERDILQNQLQISRQQLNGIIRRLKKPILQGANII